MTLEIETQDRSGMSWIIRLGSSLLKRTKRNIAALGRHNREMSILASLGDHMLDDIGITRDDVTRLTGEKIHSNSVDRTYSKGKN